MLSSSEVFAEAVEDAREAISRRTDFAVHDFGRALPVGSLKSARVKFSARRQRETLDEIVTELDSGALYLGDWKMGEIQITGLHRVIQNRFWSEVEHDVLFPPTKGAEPVAGTYRSIRWNSGRMSGVGALCLTTAGEVVLLRSFRHAARRWCIELPRGAIQPGESIIDCALREAREECGIVTTDRTKATDFGIFDADTGALMADSHIVFVNHVEVDESKVNRDVSESVLGPVIMPVKRMLAMIASGEIRDSFAQGAMMQAITRGLITL